MSEMLTLCLLGFIGGGIAVIVLIFIIVFCFIEDAWGEGEWMVGLFASIAFSIGLLSLGGYHCYVGNQEYDKVTQVYSLQPSDRFILGTSKGYYYYNLNETDVMSCIEKVSTDSTTLIQEENLQHPYLLEHKVKWEESEYFLYVPEDVRIIQYSVK